MKKIYLRSTRNLYFQMEDGMKVFYSYVTPVAFQPRNSSEVVVCENVWSITTAKHLNWIEDWAGYPRKQNRLKRNEFKEALVKARGPEGENSNDMLKTTSMVSMMFGLLATDKDKELAQKKRFFEIAGLTFPEDWDSLSNEEKEKRIKAVEQFGLKNEGARA
tara:strand:- start:7110 stop:7595 length:486 start_codon:yes stop_codon:yes gene_type:complete